LCPPYDPQNVRSNRASPRGLSAVLRYLTHKSQDTGVLLALLLLSAAFVLASVSPDLPSLALLALNKPAKDVNRECDAGSAFGSVNISSISFSAYSHGVSRSSFMTFSRNCAKFFSVSASNFLFLR